MAKGNKKNGYKSGNTKDKKPLVKKQYIDMYYMLPKEAGAKELSEAVLELNPAYAECLECWEEAGVLELSVGEESSIDMEMLELSEEELQDEFLQAYKIVAVYQIHTDSLQMEVVKKLFAGLVGRFGGLLCSDSKDFMPIIVK